jgi:cytochrome c-type biogenesis protein CcmE
MKPQRKKRLAFVLLIVLGIGVATALALTAFQENLMYFYSPSEVAEGKAPQGRAFRVGGLVVSGSVQRPGDGLTVRFELTDTAASIPIQYTGILPDLFREGQGIVALGRIDAQGVLVADEVLAKHDENYMPPEVGDALKKAGAIAPADAVHTNKATP